LSRTSNRFTNTRLALLPSCSRWPLQAPTGPHALPPHPNQPTPALLGSKHPHKQQKGGIFGIIKGQGLLKIRATVLAEVWLGRSRRGAGRLPHTGAHLLRATMSTADDKQEKKSWIQLAREKKEKLLGERAARLAAQQEEKERDGGSVKSPDRRRPGVSVCSPACALVWGVLACAPVCCVQLCVTAALHAA
jgi:hypothetical protein